MTEILDAPTTTPGRGQKDKRLHECSVCHRLFKRTEHLTRHFRRHTHEKPFQCHTCLVCFARKELHDRHQRREHGSTCGNIPLPNILDGGSDRSRGDDSLARDTVTHHHYNHHHHPKSPVDHSHVAVSQTLTSAFEHSAHDHSVIAGAQNISQSSAYQTVSPPLSIWEHRPSLADLGSTESMTVGTHPLQGSALEQLGLQCSELQFCFERGCRQTNPMTEKRSSPPVTEAPALAGSHLPSLLQAETVPDFSSFRNWELTSPSNFDVFPGSRFPPWIVSAVPSRAPSPLCYSSGTPTLGMRSITTSDQSLAHIFIPSSSIELQVIDQMREILMQSLVQLSTDTDVTFMECGNMPDTPALDRYQKMFFAMPNKNLPFTHESMPIVENPPAFNLALLADGAMYYGAYSAGIWLFEASRRLASDYLEKVTADTIPLWLLNTLLINSVFGLPGGDETSPEVTVGSLKSLTWLASRVSDPVVACSPRTEPIDYEWRAFISKESKKRSLLCVLVMTGLWSAAYGSISHSCISFFDEIELPCAEILWTATSAEQWKGLNSRARRPEKLRGRVLQVLDGSYYPCSGLASLCIIVGLLIYMDELRSEAATNVSDFRDHMRMAIDRWAGSHSPDRRDNNAVNFIAFPAAAYLRASLEVNITGAMSSFLNREFSAMRDAIRDGDLRKAGCEALSGLVPWASCHKNQISMVAIPLALIASETCLLLSKQRYINNHDSALLGTFAEALMLGDGENDPVHLWRALRKIIGNGPVTMVLSTALDAYEAELCLIHSQSVTSTPGISCTGRSDI